MNAFAKAMTSVLRSDGPPIAVTTVVERDARTTSRHAHPCGQLLGAARSLVTLTTSDGHWVVAPTTAVWIPPGFAHAMHSHGPFSGWSVYVAERLCSSLPDSLCSLAASSLLREAVIRAAGWPEGTLSLGQRALGDVILEEIRSLPRDGSVLPMPSDVRLSRVAAVLLERPGDERRLTALAFAAGTSERTITRGFVTETGMTFSEWRQRARVLKALEWLAAGKSVTAVALEVGYTDVGSFIAMFKKHLGVTPGHMIRPRGTDV